MQTFRIGRGQQNNIVINDPTVSETHCQITLDDSGRYYISDLGSTNGTYVNGSPVQGSAWLNPNDTVHIGNTILPWMDYFTTPAQPAYPQAAQTVYHQQPYQQSYQQSYQQPAKPVYQNPVRPTYEQYDQVDQPRRHNGLGTAGFILSLLALVFCWVPILNIILLFLGLVFSIVGLCLKNRRKGLAVSGLVIAIIVILLYVAGYFWIDSFLNAPPTYF